MKKETKGKELVENFCQQTADVYPAKEGEDRQLDSYMESEN